MSDFTNSGERVEGASGLTFSFGRCVQKKKLALLSLLFQVLTPTVAITRG
jgi:hypothetical protein